MKLLSPVLADLTPRHVEVFWRYQVVRTGVDFSAAMCFLVGSAFFFFASLARPADWLFLVGSVLFALKPTIDLVRSVHLRRLPAGAAGVSAASAGVSAGSAGPDAGSAGLDAGDRGGTGA